MPTRYHVERRIDAPPERVWALLADAAGYRAWNSAVIRDRGASPFAVARLPTRLS
jgi:uncharacterized protein YndB with AHSA1/START domain